jgi:hypothetical protein
MIQYAAAFRPKHWRLWNTDRRVEPGDHDPPACFEPFDREMTRIDAYLCENIKLFGSLGQFLD